MNSEIPTVTATLVHGPHGDCFVVRCPFCGRRHSHGAEPRGTDPREFVGSREPHCVNGFGHNGDYDLVWSGVEYTDKTLPKERLVLSAHEHELMCALLEKRGITRLARTIGISRPMLDRAFTGGSYCRAVFVDLERRAPEPCDEMPPSAGKSEPLFWRQARGFSESAYAKIWGFLLSLREDDHGP